MSIIYTDENKFLVKEASQDKITGKWKEIVDGIQESCKEHLGSSFISLYVGGSVAHGAAIENKSDVDTYAIVDLSKEEIERNNYEWVEEERKRMNLLFPFQRGIEIHLIPLNQIPEGKKFQMKVFAAHVYGKDFNDELPVYKLDKETLGRVRVSIEKDIEKAKGKFIGAKTEDEVKKISIWIAKRLIRSAGMMCMWKGDFFTMDIEVLVDLFSLHYPEKKEEIRKLFDYTKNPPSSKEIPLTMLKSFGDWLINEDKKVFNI